MSEHVLERVDLLSLGALHAWALDWPVSSQDWTPLCPNSPGRWHQGLPHYIGDSVAFSHFCMEHNKIHLWRWAYICPKSSTQGVVDFFRTTVASNKATLNPDFPSAIKTPLSLLTLTGGLGLSAEFRLALTSPKTSSEQSGGRHRWNKSNRTIRGEFAVGPRWRFPGGISINVNGSCATKSLHTVRKCASKCSAALRLMEQKHKPPRPGEMLLASRSQDSPQKVSQGLTVQGETKWTPNTAGYWALEIGGPSTTCAAMLLALLDTDFDCELI